MNIFDIYNKILENKEAPSIIFKYRPLNSLEDIRRFFQIINNKQLYFPTVEQLNDPFEGILCPRAFGVAGQSLRFYADEDGRLNRRSAFDNVGQQLQNLTHEFRLACKEEIRAAGVHLNVQIFLLRPVRKRIGICNQ